MFDRHTTLHYARNAVPSMPAVTESTNDSQLFEFLNNPAPMEQAISVLDSPKQSLAPLNVSLSSSPTHPNQQTTEHLEARSSPPQQLVPSQSQASVLPKNSTDISMENRLLHQEIASLNQEIAELVKRNKRIEAQKNKEASSTLSKSYLYFTIFLNLPLMLRFNLSG